MTSVNCRQTYIELGIWCIYPLAYKLYYMHGIGSYKVRLLHDSLIQRDSAYNNTQFQDEFCSAITCCVLAL